LTAQKTSNGHNAVRLLTDNKGGFAMKNHYRIIHNPVNKGIAIFHNINSDVVTDVIPGLAVLTRDAKNVVSRAERLFNHFAKELRELKVDHQLTISKDKRTIIFQEKDAKSVIEAIRNGSAASAAAADPGLQVTDQLFRELERLERSVDPDGFSDNALLARYIAGADCADSEDWRDLSRDVMPLLTSLVRDSAASARPGFFSQLCCGKKPEEEPIRPARRMGYSESDV
jgi:hypothetical protein